MHHLLPISGPNVAPPIRARRGRAAKAAGILAFLALAVGLSACQPAPPKNAATSYVTGGAYGAVATLTAPGKLSGSLAAVAGQGMPCNPTSDAVYQNKVLNAGLTIPIPITPVNAVSLGTVTNTGKVTFDHAAGTADLTETSTVENVSLLNGLITATAVQARAHETKSASGVDQHLTDGTTGGTFTNLKIAGALQPLDVAANTRIDIPAVGYVVLNEVTTIPAYFGTPPRTSVDALHVHVNNLLGVGGDIRIAHAQAGLADANGRLSGGAYVVAASVQPVLSTGALGNIALPCTGTLGKDIGYDQAAVSLGPLGTVGAGRTTANGNLPPSGPVTSTSATVGAVDLLGGLIKADAIVAKANSHAGPGGTASDATGSTFTNLVIGGQAIPLTAPANTRIDLAGLGYVTLNEQLMVRDGVYGTGPAQHMTALYVSGLHLHITVAGNALGLPVGADLVLARASTSASY